MKFELSKKARWILIVGIPCALLISVWLGANDDIDRLAHLAKKGDYATRLAAISELGSYGPSATDAIDSLTSLLVSNDSEIRRAAAQAMIQIDHRESVNRLTHAMRSSNAGVRIDAREALEQIGSKQAQRVVSTLSTQGEKRYQRARVKSGWFKKMKKSFEREKEQKYRQHRRVYRD